jgi:PST family polysaccharide transporter
VNTSIPDLTPKAEALFAQRGDLKRRTVRGAAASFVGQGAKLAIQVGSTAVLARLLTPQDYGAWAMVVALVGFVSLFTDLGLSIATIQREEITPEEVSGLFWINVAAGLALMLIILASAPLVAWFYGRHDLVWLTMAYACVAPINSLGSQHQALLQRSMRYASLAIRDILSLTAGVLVGIGCARSDLGYWALASMQVTTSVVGVIALWWQSGWRPGPPRWTAGLMPFLKFGGALTLSNILSFLVRGLDSVLLGYFFGAGGVGIYNRAQNLLVRPIEQVMPAISNVTTSAFSRLAPDSARFERNALQILGIAACLAGLVVALIMGTADWLVALLLGPQWEAVVPILRVLALFTFVEPCASLLGIFLVVRGAPGRLVRWRVLSAPITLLGLVAGLQWGPLGVATTLAASGLLIRAPLFFWYAGRALGVAPRHLFRSVMHYVFSGLVVATTLINLRHAWSPEGALRGLLAYGMLGATLYTGLVLASPGGRTLVSQMYSLVKELSIDPRGDPARGPAA